MYDTACCGWFTCQRWTVWNMGWPVNLIPINPLRTKFLFLFVIDILFLREFCRRDRRSCIRLHPSRMHHDWRTVPIGFAIQGKADASQSEGGIARKKGPGIAQGEEKKKEGGSVLSERGISVGIHVHLRDGYAFMHVLRVSHASCQ